VSNYEVVRTRTLTYLSGLTIFIFSFGGFLKAQNEFNATLGAGIPEMINLGLRYQFGQTQIGLSYGMFSSTTTALSGDAYYHFGGSSRFVSRRPWYGRVGFTYVREETTSAIDKYVYLGTRIGREFNISKRFGINVDIGAIYQLSYEEIRKEPENTGWFSINWSEPSTVLPAIGIAFFYRFPLNSVKD